MAAPGDRRRPPGVLEEASIPELVALDIETTGFDPLADGLIEVGAVRFDLDGRMGERFVSFVACDREIPPIVQRLTGIGPEQLAAAPPAGTVLRQLAAFVGDAWVVGHNVQFDLGFLEAQGLPPPAMRLDTAELASIVFPTAPSYALQRLAAELRGETPAHRALEDAEAAALVLLAVFREASSLAPATLEGLLQLVEPLGGAVAWFLEEALRARARYAFAGPAPEGAGSRAPRSSLAPLLGPSIRTLFAPSGLIAASFASYEERPEQVEMAEAVDAVLDGGGALVVEAGTGTGKSLAYLVPALRAAGRGLRVLVSTRTTTLQDQLAASDLPRLVRAFGVDVSAAVLKGRANYLCPRRWHLFRLSATTSDEARFAMKTLVWRERTRTGDRAELNLQGGGEHLAWSRVCAEDETCTARRCALVRGGCYLERARDRAAHADLVVANHALLLSDAARSNRLLPDVDVVIADEAHHLDEVASRVFGVDVTAADLRRAVQRVAQSAAAVRPDADLTALRDLAQLALAPGGALALRSAPAHAGAYIDRAFARGRHAAVFTSATLAVAGSFAFVMDRFGLGDRAASLRVGSGFDYHRQALLVLPTGLPDPFEPAFVDRVAAAVAAVGGALAGRTLVLFTSHSMLRAVHARIAGWGEEERIAVLAQSLGGSRRQLLEQFAAGRAVLLGTSTFWEGIDLPGDLLRCVVIAKLPFPVPDDPLVAGRSERYEDPFRDYHLPLAALRLRQGFGRLIRSRDDRGAVVLLDRRLTSRTYGETFLRSLPDCEIVRADVAALGQTVARWCDAGKDGRRLD